MLESCARVMSFLVSADEDSVFCGRTYETSDRGLSSKVASADFTGDGREHREGEDKFCRTGAAVSLVRQGSMYRGKVRGKKRRESLPIRLQAYRRQCKGAGRCNNKRFEQSQANKGQSKQRKEKKKQQKLTKANKSKANEKASQIKANESSVMLA